MMLPTPEQVRDMFPTREGFGKYLKLDIRREGQPISTDEFLEKALSVRLHGLDDNTSFSLRVSSWITGNFTEAMEGLE